MSKKKVVITGIGMVTPCGNGKDAAWSAVKAGKSGIGRITKFDPSRCTCQVAGELKDFDAYLAEKGYVDKKAMRHMDPFSIYAVAAAVEAWKSAPELKAATKCSSPERCASRLSSICE